MADITLISGSTLGGAEYVAEHLAEKLEEAGFTTETLHGPLLRSTVDNSVRKLGSTGSYPKNNCCSVFELCITPHSDPSLYGPGSPIIHS